MTLEDRYTLETPDQVEIDFELAGLGSRFCAMAIDTLLICLGVFALGLFAAFWQLGWWSLLTDQVDRAGDSSASLLLSIVIIVVAFLFSGGYYLFCEYLMRGQTPGKRAMKLRAIRDDGTAMLGQDLLIRNLLRFVDFLPAFYGVGSLVMFFHPQSKRLGDIAAGTIVVKEGQLDYRARTDKRYVLEAVAEPTANRELRPEHQRLLAGFLARRTELLPAARLKLAAELVQRMHAVYGGDETDPERYLELLLEGRHYEFRNALRSPDPAPAELETARRVGADDAAQGTTADAGGPGAGVDPPVS